MNVIFMGLRASTRSRSCVRLARNEVATRAAKPWEKSGLTRAERVCAFIETLVLTTGQHAGQRFKMRPWQ